jgi:Flp pilus assembly protein TadD
MNAVGVAFDITKRPDEAQDYYKTALEVKPEEPMVLNNYALSYAFQGNYKEAIATMKRAVVRLSKAEDKKRRAELNLSLIYGLAGMMEPAEVLLRKHLPEPLVYNNLGMYAHLANDNDLAQTYLHKAVMESPTFYQKAWETLKVVEPLVSKEE